MQKRTDGDRRDLGRSPVHILAGEVGEVQLLKVVDDTNGLDAAQNAIERVVVGLVEATRETFRQEGSERLLWQLEELIDSTTKLHHARTQRRTHARVIE